MGTIRRQSFQATLVLGFGALLSLVVRLFIYTSFLEEEEIGLLTVLIDTANLFAAFIPLGSQSIFVRYLPFFRNDQGKVSRGLLFIGLKRSLLGLAIFASLFLIFSNNLIAYYSERASLLSEYFFYLLPLVVVRVIFLLGQSYARALKKNVFPLVIKEIIVTTLTAVIVIIFAKSWFNLDSLVLSYIGIYFISSVIMTSYLVHLGELSFKHDHKPREGRNRNEIFVFGLFAILTSGGNFIIKNVDSILITSLSTLANAGIYNIAFLIGMVIELPRRAVTQITSPFLAEAAAKNNHNQTKLIYQKSSLNQFVFGSYILICIWSNIDNIFAIIPNGTLYQAGKYVVLFIGLAKLVDMSAGVNTQVIQNSEYYKFNFYSLGALAIIGVATNILLIPILGINGAALASLISLTLINILRGVYIKLKLNLQPLNWKFAVAIIIGVGAYLIAEFLPKLDNTYLDLVYRTGITTVFFFSLTILLKVSSDLNDYLKTLIKKTL